MDETFNAKRNLRLPLSGTDSLKMLDLQWELSIRVRS